jgi:hypothetical protein
MIAIIVCIAGIILYLAADGKPSEAGRIMFWTGLAGVIWFYGGMKFL